MRCASSTSWSPVPHSEASSNRYAFSPLATENVQASAVTQLPASIVDSFAAAAPSVPGAGPSDASSKGRRVTRRSPAQSAAMAPQQVRIELLKIRTPYPRPECLHEPVDVTHIDGECEPGRSLLTWSTGKRRKVCGSALLPYWRFPALSVHHRSSCSCILRSVRRFSRCSMTCRSSVGAGAALWRWKSGTLPRAVGVASRGRQGHTAWEGGMQFPGPCWRRPARARTGRKTAGAPAATCPTAPCGGPCPRPGARGAGCRAGRWGCRRGSAAWPARGWESQSHDYRLFAPL